MEFGTSKILITGADGWLGKNLLNALINGIKDSPILIPPTNIYK